MIKFLRFRRVVFFVVFLTLVLPAVAYAVLPAVLFAEIATAAVESIVIRSVARSTVSAVTTAANDASWISTFNSWMLASRAVGTLVVSQLQDASGVPATYEIQIAAPAEDLTKASVSSSYRLYSNIPSSYTLTGALLYPPDTTFPSIVSARDAYITWWNSVAQTRFFLVADTFSYPTGCITTSSGFYCDFYMPNDNYTGVGVPGFVGSAEAKDGIKRVLRTNSVWGPDNTDPDWLPSEKSNLNGAGAIRFSGIIDGKASVVDLYAGSTGYGLQFQQQVTPSNIRQLSVVLDSAAVPVNLQQYQGQGAFNLPTFESSTGGAASVNIEFPSDYARAGEAYSAASPLINALTSTTTVSDPANLTATDMPGWGNSFDNLLGWSLPGHVSTCPTGQLDLSSVLGAGKVYAFDAHCQLINDNFAQLRAAMMVVWTIAALFLLLRA